MHEALNLKVLQQTSVGVFKIMAADHPKSSPKHAHRKGIFRSLLMGAKLPPVMMQIHFDQNLSVCSECLGESYASIRQEEQKPGS